jgi:hypothetical protein
MGYSPEYAVLEGDPAYLARLADLGGGVVLEQPVEALAHDIQGSGLRQDLWPYLLGLATLLLPLDVAVRRLALNRYDLARAWASVWARFRKTTAPARGGRGERLGRLFDAKSRAVGRVDHPPYVPPPAAPTPPAQSPAPPPTPPATEDGTLAGRLLERRHKRRGG